jgi:glycosyltransferase involved in cell wall biosynthesis
MELSETRKGGELLGGMLGHIQTRPLHLVLLGSGGLDLRVSGVKIHRLGYVADERRVAEISAAADLFIHPSPQDNFPNVVVESLASGTPVVAYRTGGLHELIIQDKTGWLVNEISPPALAEAVDRALDGDSLTAMREACRRFAEQTFRAEDQAAAYLELFERGRKD